jgi:probable phosphoglycerate mutase
MALVLLIRHALTEATGRRLSGTTPGIHLSAEGKAQAVQLAERLNAIPLKAVYSSPLERCRETAETVASPLALGVVPVPELIEVGYGRWTGRSLAQLSRTALWKKVQQSPSSIRFPDGESLTEVQRRSVDAVDAIAARHHRGTVAVVSHADVIRLLLAHYAGVHVDLFQRLIVSPVSVSAVLLGDRVPRILRMNDTGTLDDLVRRAAARRDGRRDGSGAPAPRPRRRTL